MSWTPSGGVPSTPRLPSARLIVPSSIRPSSSFPDHTHNPAHIVEAPFISAGQAILPASLLPNQPHNAGLDSTASSVVNMDLNDGILLQDVDVGTEDAEDITVMTLDSDMAKMDEASKKSLRDQLRKTLSNKTTGQEISRPPSRLKGKQREICDISFEEVSRYPPRQYFVLTDAGKPVFISPPEGGDSGDATATIGVMQALISVFLDDNDKLRCINAGRTRISFLLRSPLYYACASSWGEPESVTRSHLEFLHLQILSIVTAAQLRRIFERRTNFDLGRLLTGAEGFLNSLLDRLEFDVSMSTSSLQCLKLDPHIRKKVAEALLPTSKMKDVLYILLVAQSKVVTLIRPKKHSIHPADVHILLNTIHSPSIQKSPASSSWIPVCLPKFNPSGFVNTYISFLQRTGVDDGVREEVRQAASEIVDTRDVVASSKSMSTEKESSSLTRSEAVLVCVSASGDFDSIRSWCDSVTLRLEKEGFLKALMDACISGRTEYSVSDLGIPGLRHFVYKSRTHVQVTAPVFEDPYHVLDDRRRLITLYQTLHDGIHAKSGQEGTLKLQYIRTEKESVMGWITQLFEMYITLSARLPKTAVIGAANSVARWVKREEAKLFLRDAPVF